MDCENTSLLKGWNFRYVDRPRSHIWTNGSTQDMDTAWSTLLAAEATRSKTINAQIREYA